MCFKYQIHLTCGKHESTLYPSCTILDNRNNKVNRRINYVEIGKRCIPNFFKKEKSKMNSIELIHFTKTLNLTELQFTISNSQK